MTAAVTMRFNFVFSTTVLGVGSLFRTSSTIAFVSSRRTLKRKTRTLTTTTSRTTSSAAAASNKDDESARLEKALERSSKLQQDGSTAWYLSSKNTSKKIPFKCTSCGRCCQTKGSVYLSPDEVQGAAALLNTTTVQFIQRFASHTISPKQQQQQQQQQQDNGNDSGDQEASIRIPWIKLKNMEDTGACIFLDEVSNQCTIYEARPVQCSTYPFWSNIMRDVNAWNDEVRIPDDADKSWTIPYWSVERGGCEGMKWIGGSSCTDDSDSSPTYDEPIDEETGVPPEEAHRQLLEYQRAELLFPRAPHIPVDSNNN